MGKGFHAHANSRCLCATDMTSCTWQEVASNHASVIAHLNAGSLHMCLLSTMLARKLHAVEVKFDGGGGGSPLIVPLCYRLRDFSYTPFGL